MSIPNSQAYHYQRHEPEKTTLYKLIQTNWLTFQEQVQYNMGYPLPDGKGQELKKQRINTSDT